MTAKMADADGTLAMALASCCPRQSQRPHFVGGRYSDPAAVRFWLRQMADLESESEWMQQQINWTKEEEKEPTVESQNAAAATATNSNSSPFATDATTTSGQGQAASA